MSHFSAFQDEGSTDSALYCSQLFMCHRSLLSLPLPSAIRTRGLLQVLRSRSLRPRARRHWYPASYGGHQDCHRSISLCCLALPASCTFTTQQQLTQQHQQHSRLQYSCPLAKRPKPVQADRAEEVSASLQTRVSGSSLRACQK